mgnify:CR=1 FL=1
MNTQTTFFWRWLILVIIGTLLFGLNMIFLPNVTNGLFNAMFFPNTDINQIFSETAQHYLQFTYGVLGAIMVGWASLMLYIALRPFRRGEREAWTMITTSIIIWFVVDSAYSLYMGYIPNVVLNIIFLILYLIPLGATYRHFHHVQ